MLSASGMQYLLTLPGRMASAFARLEGRASPEWYATSDPPGAPLGSGGGTANLLYQAWRETGANSDFETWLGNRRKLILHAGGQSRRLPAYAATGKLLMPIPVFRWSRGQRLDQTLLDLQLPDYQRVLSHAGPKTVAMVTSGDVLLRFARNLPAFPEVDVLGLGMWVAPEKAKDFGVFCSPRGKPTELAFFLQKPPATKIRSLGQDYLCLVDTGMWLLSARAVEVLMQRSGWDSASQRFKNGSPEHYELYSQFGLALGRVPTAQDSLVNKLTCAVVPLPEAQFFHFGTSLQMIESVAALQHLVLDETKVGGLGLRERPDQVTQNSVFGAGLKREGNETLWVENSVVGAGWQLGSEHVITGVPANNWKLELPSGTCLDFAPVGTDRWCIRAYRIRDHFKGNLGDETTLWFGRRALSWLESRGLKPEVCGLELREDIQKAALFPVVDKSGLSAGFIQWLLAHEPASNPGYARRWCNSPRLSAQQLMEQVNLDRLYAQRATLRSACALPMLRNFRSSVFFRLDLQSTARLFAGNRAKLPALRLTEQDDPMHLVHERMFRSAVLRCRRDSEWRTYENEAFAKLREVIANEAQLSPASPRKQVLDDQIVWARSPVRLDLAGGWSDTPPYCIEHGGSVLNLAVDLNGQPPIQVFAKLSKQPELVIRSIDLGAEERVRTYEQLAGFARPGSAFALAKAAFALAGFLPRFQGEQAFASLRQQLDHFGGGIELSLLSAVPKGSGLGTSSILAATVLAALGDLCGLHWDRHVLFRRTLALEQMLTTGGGWQDQAGAIFGGIKLIETTAGLQQIPSVRWLPTQLFGRNFANGQVLLYYTGITRLAKNILAEIVRGLFLNSPKHLGIIGEIAANAEFAAAAVQKCDYSLLGRAIANSWELNQQLDSGTNPASVHRILDAVEEYIIGAKLLGAGGGGYLLMLAKDEPAAARIRCTLNDAPPNALARFVDFSLSEDGLQLTRS